MRIACICHVPYEGPGTIASWSVTRGHEFRVIAAVTGEFPPLEDVDMVVVMGGPMGAGDAVALPWLAVEKQYISSAIAARKLVLGVCLGSQLVAEVLGGTVRRGTGPEIGWFPVRLTDAGRESALFGGWPDESVVGHWHRDTFDLPPFVGAAASSTLTANQAFEARGGRVAGLQFHLEWTPDAVAQLVASCGDDLTGGAWVQSAEELLSGASRSADSQVLLFGLLDRMGALS
jgi:GMP synthase-like glutamine amidotransferase